MKWVRRAMYTAYLSGKDDAYGSVALVVKDDVLQNKRDEAFNGARADGLNNTANKVRCQGSTESRSHAACNRDDASDEQDVSPTGGNSKRDENEIGRAHHQDGKRCQQVNLPDWRSGKLGKDRECVDALGQMNLGQ